MPKWKKSSKLFTRQKPQANKKKVNCNNKTSRTPKSYHFRTSIEFRGELMSINYWSKDSIRKLRRRKVKNCSWKICSRPWLRSANKNLIMKLWKGWSECLRRIDGRKSLTEAQGYLSLQFDIFPYFCLIPFLLNYCN